MTSATLRRRMRLSLTHSPVGGFLIANGRYSDLSFPRHAFPANLDQ